MADYGTTAGIGTGIGEAMREIGAGLKERGERRTAERDKTADAFEKQAQDIAANIAQMGGANAPGAAPYVQQLYGIVQKHNALFPAHETPALIQRIQKFIGKRPGAPTVDPRSQMTAGELISAAPRFPGGQVDLQTEIAQVKQAYMKAFPTATDEEAQQKAFEIVADRKQQGARPTLHVVEKPYFNKNTNRWEQVSIDPADPTKPIVTQLPEGYAPPAPKIPVSAQYNVKRAPGGRPDAITVQGVTYTADDMDKDETPDVVKAHWATEIKNWKEDTATKEATIQQHQQFQLTLQSRAAAIASERQTRGLIQGIALADVRNKESLARTSKTLLDEANDLRKAADHAVEANNVQEDIVFLQRLSSVARTGRGLNKEQLDRIASGGRPGVRLENVIDEVIGSQAFPPEILNNLVNYVRNEYNSRYQNWADNKDDLEQAKSEAVPDGKDKSKPTKSRVKFGELPQTK